MNIFSSRNVVNERTRVTEIFTIHGNRRPGQLDATVEFRRAVASAATVKSSRDGRSVRAGPSKSCRYFRRPPRRRRLGIPFLTSAGRFLFFFLFFSFFDRFLFYSFSPGRDDGRVRVACTYVTACTVLRVSRTANVSSRLVFRGRANS